MVQGCTHSLNYRPIYFYFHFQCGILPILEYRVFENNYLQKEMTVIVQCIEFLKLKQCIFFYNKQYHCQTLDLSLASRL